MCTTHVHTYAYPDGRRAQDTHPTLCSASRHGQPCVDNVVLKHPTQYVQYAPVPMAPTPPSVYAGPGSYAFPPTPPLSSTPVLYRSDDSDRSHRSNSSSRRSRRPSSVYVNGQRVSSSHAHHAPHHSASHHRDHGRSSSRRERIVLVDSPPTPRTPPQMFSAPHTAPSSPSFNPSATYTPEHVPSSRRPVIVDERQRPFVQIEVLDAPRPRAPRGSHHARQSSASSRGSSRVYYSSAAEREEEDIAAEEERNRRRRRHEARRAREAETKERELREKELREQQMRRRIAEANEEILHRPAVPMPSTPSRRVSAAGPGASKAKDREAELVDALRRLEVKEQRLEKEQRRAERERELDEDEAQQARLRERMVPRRRATVGPGSRRHRVLYDDGIYRWE